MSVDHSRLYDRGALRALEAAAIARLDGDGFALMARAGQAGWRELLGRWPQAQRIVVACGPGNNGGDGYVLARHALESGRRVSVLRLGGHAPGSDLARRACDAFVEAGGRIDAFEGRVPECDVLVDALFGIGLSRAPDPDAAALVGAINAAGAPVLALDAPSGVDTDTGAVPGAAVRADATLQFIAAHAGLATGAALDHVGALALAGLEVPAELFTGVEPVAARLGRQDLRGRFSPRARGAHKGDSGYLLCIGGDAGTGGAVLLAAEAALRCGAGLVGVATRPAHVAAALARRPEVMARAVDGAGALRPLLERAGMVAIGPGLGQSAWGSALFGVALAAGRPEAASISFLKAIGGGAAINVRINMMEPLLGLAQTYAQSENADTACQIVGFLENTQQLPAVLRDPVHSFLAELKESRPDARDLLAQGRTDKEIIDYLVDELGFVIGPMLVVPLCLQVHPTAGIIASMIFTFSWRM